MTTPHQEEGVSFEGLIATIQDAFESMVDIIDLEWGEGVADEEGQIASARHALDNLISEYNTLRGALGEAESLNRKHDTETTSIHADMLALARLVGVRYDGASSPAGFLHADIMPAIRKALVDR